jgi:hypothetical protein
MEMQHKHANNPGTFEGKPKRTKPDRRWTLLFIGDHGRVVTLKRFKGIVFFAGFIFALSIAAIVLLYLYNQNIHKKNEKLQGSLDIFQKRIKALRHEKDILMARLVLAETRVKESLGESTEGRMDKSFQVEALKNTSQKETSTQSEKEKTTLAAKEPGKPGVAPKPQEPDLSVNVEDFNIQNLSAEKKLKIQFKIKNTSPNSQRVSGHAIVVLKGEDLKPKMWLSVPPIALVDGKPTGRQRGHGFAINYFRTMRFTTNAPPSPHQYKKAAVYVFTAEGDLLLEKDYPVEISVQQTQTIEPTASDNVLPALKGTGTQEMRKDSQSQVSETEDSLPFY